MKKGIAIVAAALFVLSIAGLSFAAEQKAAPAAPVEKKEAAPLKVKHLAGEVTAVDAAAKTLTVKGNKGNTVFSVDEKAAKSLAGVKVGDKVAVKYTEKDGKNIAIAVSGKEAEKKGSAAVKQESAPKVEEKKPVAPAEKKKTGGY